MKLLFIAPSAYLLGGVQDWLYSTVIGLRRRGHDVSVGIPNASFHNGKKYNDKYANLNAEFFVNRSGSDEGRIRGLIHFLEKRDSDIVIGVNIGNLFEAVAREHKHSQRRFVMTLHAIEANYFADMRKYRGIIDGVIATNRLSEKMAVEVGRIQKDRVYYAPYGISIDENVQAEIHDLSIIRIAWVGRIEEKQKRIYDLVKIIGALDTIGVEYIVSIAGDGPDTDSLAKRLERWISKGKVRLCGVMSKDELRLFYYSNDILLITSEWETGPIVAWEAVIAGLKIVCSRYTGCKAEGTLVDHETALLFDIGDYYQAAIRIALLRDQDLSKRLQSNARKVVSSKYSNEVSLDAWERAFLRILAAEKMSMNPNSSWSREKGYSGRLERYVGTECAELLRTVFPKKVAEDAGSEWPHSLQGISDQSRILESAKNIERFF
jgi:glycosyltransferase involved in cell wall biosynthesis